MRNQTAVIFLILFFSIIIFTGSCTNCNPATANATDIQLSGKLSATSYTLDETIIVTAIVKNHSLIPVTFEEGRFFLVFDINGKATTFLQANKASYASGRKMINVQPGEEYTEMFNVYLKQQDNQPQISSAKYKVHISYSGSETWRSSITPAENKVQNGIVEIMNSDKMTIEVDK